MTTEINLENKKRFFAQYFGQRVMIHRNDPVTLLLVRHLESSLMTKRYLELKSLADISDKDAIEWCGGVPKGWEIVKIYHTNKLDEGYCGIKIRRLYKKDELPINDDGYKYSMLFPQYDWQSLDYLRRQRYLVPFDGLSVEEIIQAGWAKKKKV